MNCILKHCSQKSSKYPQWSVNWAGKYLHEVLLVGDFVLCSLYRAFVYYSEICLVDLIECAVYGNSLCEPNGTAIMINILNIRSCQQIVCLSNPLDRDVSFTCNNSNTTHFSVAGLAQGTVSHVNTMSRFHFILLTYMRFVASQLIPFVGCIFFFFFFFVVDLEPWSPGYCAFLISCQ